MASELILKDKTERVPVASFNEEKFFVFSFFASVTC